MLFQEFQDWLGAIEQRYEKKIAILEAQIAFLEKEKQLIATRFLEGNYEVLKYYLDPNYGKEIKTEESSKTNGDLL